MGLDISLAKTIILVLFFPSIGLLYTWVDLADLRCLLTFGVVDATP
jgi:hypothetical protein